MNADYFAGRLKELREQAGLTQPQLADRAGMNRFGIAKLEQGVSKPSWESVIALCQALNVTPNEFIREPSVRPEPKRGRPPKEGGAEPLGKKATATARKRKARP
jgi:transcriptional regulator with XRE-family HTH domain